MGTINPNISTATPKRFNFCRIMTISTRQTAPKNTASDYRPALFYAPFPGRHMVLAIACVCVRGWKFCFCGVGYACSQSASWWVFKICMRRKVCGGRKLVGKTFNVSMLVTITQAKTFVTGRLETKELRFWGALQRKLMSKLFARV